ncbi:MAG TPA: tail fiber protein [Verrucomicrobiae bacterium]
MAQPFLSEIRIFSFNFAPSGWAMCNGQLMLINQNQALFALLGTTYGGDGVSTFALPNLQTRVPVHMGNGFTLGQTGGEQTHTLTAVELAQHTHGVVASANAANQGSSANNYWANGNQPAYAASADTQMAAGSISSVGGNQSHNNMPPFLTLNFCIALQGVFPSQT